MRENMNKNVRLSIDMTAGQHMHLKMQAAKKGMSIREYMLEALAFKEAAEEVEAKSQEEELDSATFRKGLERLRKERHKLAKNLSKR